MPLDENGHEIPDPTPMAMPAGFKRPESLAEQVQRLVRGGLSRHAEAMGEESFDEADDFDVEDEQGDPATIYETQFDPILGREISPAEFKANQDYYRGAYEKATEDELNPRLDLNQLHEELKNKQKAATAEKPTEETSEKC